MRRIPRTLRIGLILALTAALAGCGHREASNPQATMTSSQMEQKIADINNDPQLTPQQKAGMAEMIRDHVTITSARK